MKSFINFFFVHFLFITISTCLEAQYRVFDFKRIENLTEKVEENKILNNEILSDVERQNENISLFLNSKGFGFIQIQKIILLS